MFIRDISLSMSLGRTPLLLINAIKKGHQMILDPIMHVWVEDIWSRTGESIGGCLLFGVHLNRVGRERERESAE